MKTAQETAFDVQRDIQYGEFDPTYRKYKIHSTASATDLLGKAAQQGSRLMALWDHYVDYLTPDASPKTINGTYNPVRAHIGRCKTDGLIDPLKFRQELLKVTTPIAGPSHLVAAFGRLQVGTATSLAI